MKQTLPIEIVKNACIISDDNGCVYSDPEIRVEYRGNMYNVSDRNFADDNLVYLSKHDGLPVRVTDCLIDNVLVDRVKKSQKKWAKIKGVELI
jgi:hypothetical protein